MRFATAFSFIVSAVLAVAAPQTVPPAQVTINTPQAVQQCFNSQITWAGGTPPYQISVLQGGSMAVLEDLGTLTASPLTWLCKVPANTQIFLRIKDAQGVIGETGTFTVGAGDPSKCGASTSSGATTGGTSPAGTDTTPAATTPAAVTPATTPAGTTPAATASSSSGTLKAQSTPSKTSSGASSTPTKQGGGGAGQLNAPVALAGAAALAMAVFA